MTIKLASYVPEWTERAAAWLKAANGANLADVTAPGDAWYIAHRAGFWKEANDAGHNDGPIQSALEVIFPNVTFKGAKRY